MINKAALFAVCNKENRLDMDMNIYIYIYTHTRTHTHRYIYIYAGTIYGSGVAVREEGKNLSDSKRIVANTEKKKTHIFLNIARLK